MKKKVMMGILGFNFLPFAYGEVLPIWPGEVVGRDLNVPIGKGLGHVGLTTGDATNSPTEQVIEVLDEPTVIQLNNLRNFKSRTKYWGSRWGIGDQATKTHQLLVEANHQRWWKATYTKLPKYELGYGDLKTGIGSHKGTFRCDTFIAWAFSTQGYNQLIGLSVMTPSNVWSTFPKANNQFFSGKENEEVRAPLIDSSDAYFDSLTAEQLNNLDLEEFLKIADLPLGEATPAHIASEWKFAQDELVNDEYRGALIDSLSFIKDPTTIKKFIEMYDETTNRKIKKQLLIGIDRYTYKYIDLTKPSENKKLLQDFYERILSKNLSAEDYDSALNTYLNVNDNEHLSNNRMKIENALSKMSHEDALRFYIILVHRSEEFEKRYIPETIQFLKKCKNSSLDEMFFGTTKMGIKSFKDPNSILQIKEYMFYVKDLYGVNATLRVNEDPYFNVAKTAYDELNKEIENIE